MVTLPGQLAIKTIRGKNGAFNVGRLTTDIGEFVIKNAELDQYREGKYDGEFVIFRIYSKPWQSGAYVGIDTRAELAGMTLSGVDQLSKDESHSLGAREIDPVDEETAKPPQVPVTPQPVAQPIAGPRSASHPLVDTTPFGAAAAARPVESASPKQDPDAALFGTLWPLGSSVKLDSTVDRRLLRQQCGRLDDLGYEFDYTSQNWQLKAA